jgi:hypothetical protein
MGKIKVATRLIFFFLPGPGIALPIVWLCTTPSITVLWAGIFVVLGCIKSAMLIYLPSMLAGKQETVSPAASDDILAPYRLKVALALGLVFGFNIAGVLFGVMCYFLIYYFFVVWQWYDRNLDKISGSKSILIRFFYLAALPLVPGVTLESIRRDKESSKKVFSDFCLGYLIEGSILLVSLLLKNT